MVLYDGDEAERVHGKHREIVGLQQEIPDRQQKIQGTLISLVNGIRH